MPGSKRRDTVHDATPAVPARARNSLRPGRRTYDRRRGPMRSRSSVLPLAVLALLAGAMPAAAQEPSSPVATPAPAGSLAPEPPAAPEAPPTPAPEIPAAPAPEPAPPAAVPP